MEATLINVGDDGLVRDSTCSADPDGTHDVNMLDFGAFCCDLCGYPARWSDYQELWYVVRPFLIVEEIL
jgi:hypothetical protein